MTLNGLAAVLVIAAMSGSATLRDSHVTYKQALSACGGALGSVSFALGHARIGSSPGVDIDEAPADGGKLSAVLEDGGSSKSAKISIDQTQRSVSAKHVRVVRNGTVACILAD